MTPEECRRSIRGEWERLSARKVRNAVRIVEGLAHDAARHNGQPALWRSYLPEDAYRRLFVVEGADELVAAGRMPTTPVPRFVYDAAVREADRLRAELAAAVEKCRQLAGAVIAERDRSYALGQKHMREELAPELAELRKLRKGGGGA